MLSYFNNSFTLEFRDELQQNKSNLPPHLKSVAG